MRIRVALISRKQGHRWRFSFFIMYVFDMGPPFSNLENGSCGGLKSTLMQTLASVSVFFFVFLASKHLCSNLWETDFRRSV